MGEFQYQDGNLELIHYKEGRMVVSGYTYDYQYFIKDNLGNTRVLIENNSGSANIAQISN